MLGFQIGLLRSSEETVQHKNIFIVCKTPEVAFEVHTELEKNGIQSLLADMDTMSTSDVVRKFKLCRFCVFKIQIPVAVMRKYLIINRWQSLPNGGKTLRMLGE